MRTFTRSVIPSFATSCWQQQLRQSVRLYLALGSQPVNQKELENLLQSTEQELVDYLLQGERPSAESVAQARHLVDLAQHRLLNSETDVEQLMSEVTTARQWA
jgi:hypothetical protein